MLTRVCVPSEMVVEGQVSTMFTVKVTVGAAVVCYGVELAVSVIVVEVPFRA